MRTPRPWPCDSRRGHARHRVRPGGAPMVPGTCPASSGDRALGSTQTFGVRRRRHPEDRWTGRGKRPRERTWPLRGHECGVIVVQEVLFMTANEQTEQNEQNEQNADGVTETTAAPVEQPVAETPEVPEAAEPAKTEAETETETETEAGTEPEAADPFALPHDPLALIFQAPDLSALPPVTRPSRSSRTERADATDDGGGDDQQDGQGEDDDQQSGSRSSRRRRRSRGRSGGQDQDRGNDDGADQSQRGAGSRDQDGAPDPDEGEGESSGTRRRRKRRRGDVDMEMEGGAGDDPENTVTRVRAPRQTGSTGPEAVTSLKGSTRLEAKRQRRRDSRSGGRQRRHVITEAEFLARRESVDRKMLVRQREHRIQIAVMEDGVLAEHFVSNTTQDSLIGNVYVGKVQNVLPSMEAAFVDIGRGRNAVLYAGEVNWDAASLEGKSRKIENALKSGDSVLVQVTKDPVGHKGARLTSQISLPGRYLVYVPGGSMTGISRKLPDVERSRLKKILKDHLPENAGVIVRTAAEGTSEQELMHDINRLRAQWEGIEAQSSSTKTLAPELLYSEPDLTIKVVRDVFNEDFSGMVVQGEEVWDNIEAYVTYVAPDLLPRLEQWKPEEHGGEDLFASNRIDEQLQKALDRKVFLPSGGSLVIDRTEAMTVVDVNTGKFTGSGGNLEETVTKNNLEAAEEIVRQLRLRDIGGIIVIDFIDMVLESNRDLVLRRMVECLGRDRTKHQVAEVTSLGLVQMTRKRMGTGLVEIFSETCEHCNGRGIIVHDMPVEHRRAHTAHGEQRAPSGSSHGGGSGGSDGNAHDGGRKSSRSERRRRSRERQAERERQEPEAPAERQVSPEEEAERKARAEAARAAFANMAAAAASAHEDKHEDKHDKQGDRQDRKPEEQQGQQQDRQQAEQRGDREGAAEASEREASTLTIGGESVEMPRGRRASRRAESAPDLSSLESALDEKAPHDQQGPSEAPPAEEGTSGPGRRASGRSRGRRGRPAGEQNQSQQPAPAEQPAPAGQPAPAEQHTQAEQQAPATASVTPTTAPAAPAARPARRRRAASSDGTSGDIRTVEAPAAGAEAGQGRRFSASATGTAQAKAPEPSGAPAPMMLGVGVKAEDIARPE
ncbi:Rne/Rng family ribonuclease [Cellulosimicrobium funkei]|nr:Rne/Rng family ribonuclease [Cellulosimicrobium funkei]